MLLFFCNALFNTTESSEVGSAFNIRQDNDMTRTVPPASGTTLGSLLASVSNDELQAFRLELHQPNLDETVLKKLNDDSLRLFLLLEEARLRSNTLLEQMQQLTTAYKQRLQEKDFSHDTEYPTYKEAHTKLREDENEVRVFHKVLTDLMRASVRLQFGSYSKGGEGIGITSDFNVVETPVHPRRSTLLMSRPVFLDRSKLS